MDRPPNAIAQEGDYIFRPDALVKYLRGRFREDADSRALLVKALPYVAGEARTDRTARAWLKDPPATTYRIRSAHWPRFCAVLKVERHEQPGFSSLCRGEASEEADGSATIQLVNTSVKLRTSVPTYTTTGEPRAAFTLQSGENRIVKADGVPFDYRSVIVRKCELIDTSGNRVGGWWRPYVWSGYAAGGPKKPGVVNLVFEGTSGDILLAMTVRPATQKLMTEAVRGFPERHDKAPTHRATMETLEELGRQIAVVIADDGAIKSLDLHLSTNHPDSGALSDRVSFMVSVIDKLNYADIREEWQLGVVRIWDHIAFFEACERGGGLHNKLPSEAFKVVGLHGHQINEDDLVIEDGFTITVANLARFRLGELAERCEQPFPLLREKLLRTFKGFEVRIKSANACVASRRAAHGDSIGWARGYVRGVAQTDLAQAPRRRAARSRALKLAAKTP